MVADELKYRILTSLGFPPTVEQDRAVSVFSDFLTDRNDRSVMVLRGCAGTGKTTLAAAVVRALTALQQKIVLLAPTGRAAKVFSLYAGQPAFTIHRRIYRQKSLEGGFSLGFNAAQDTLFIVDEASMISGSSSLSSLQSPLSPLAREGQGLGSSLLDDLVQFVYGGRNCRLLLIGDHAQLPPVGETDSPALNASCLRGYGLDVYESNLNEVLRQAAESGILFNATRIRGYGGTGERVNENSSEMDFGGVQGNLVPPSPRAPVPPIKVSGFLDIHVVPGDELIEQLATSYSRAGLDDTIVVTRSNKRANIYNEGIRRTILDREDELCRGDRLMIVKNNYYWLATLPSFREGSGVGLGGTFLANGDVAVVHRVRNVHEQYGFRFAEVTLSFPDYDDCELTATVLLDTLTSEAPALTREQQTQLFEQVMADYADIPLKADRMKKLKEDRYYNALQVKFAYAVTCHKAQGGQWAHVYVDQGYMTDDMLTPEYYHWLYTAFTRATEQLYLVNWPQRQIEE